MGYSTTHSFAIGVEIPRDFFYSEKKVYATACKHRFDTFARFCPTCGKPTKPQVSTLVGAQPEALKILDLRDINDLDDQIRNGIVLSQGLSIQLFWDNTGEEVILAGYILTPSDEILHQKWELPRFPTEGEIVGALLDKSIPYVPDSYGMHFMTERR